MDDIMYFWATSVDLSLHFQVTIPLGFHDKCPLSVSLIARHGGDRFLLDTLQTMYATLREQIDIAAKTKSSGNVVSREQSAEIAKEKVLLSWIGYTQHLNSLDCYHSVTSDFMTCYEVEDVLCSWICQQFCLFFFLFFMVDLFISFHDVCQIMRIISSVWIIIMKFVQHSFGRSIAIIASFLAYTYPSSHTILRGKSGMACLINLPLCQTCISVKVNLVSLWMILDAKKFRCPCPSICQT